MRGRMWKWSDLRNKQTGCFRSPLFLASYALDCSDGVIYGINKLDASARVRSWLRMRWIALME
jgi:hypothetical protein